MTQQDDERHAYAYTLCLEKLGDSRLNSGSFHVYRWPAHVNGTADDRTVIIEQFNDGNCVIYLDANEPSLKAKLLQLRRMANPDR
jgi:hypothetical protein